MSKGSIQNKTTFGREGERLAANYLTSAGMQILERNFRIREGEIDLIVMDGTTLVFVEVKSGHSDAFGEPETWVNPRKQRQIGKVAAAYLQAKEIENVDCRFDVVAVTFTQGKPHIKHIENAFWLEEETY